VTPFLVASSGEEALATWVPPAVLVWVLVGILTLVGTGFVVALRALLGRLTRIETALEDAAKEIGRLANFATREQVTEMLSNLGNRFDDRTAKLREEVTRLEVRVARLEERAPRRSKA
jgi:hypothetical protein